MPCLLCGNSATVTPYFSSKYHRFMCCDSCNSIYRHPDTFLGAADEEARYLTHNNDPKDPGYRNFVRPLVERVQSGFDPASRGLDYGCGTGPVVARMLSETGYSIALYDPFFQPDKDVLKGSYDFIVCCEVIEHFHRPLDEFRLLYNLLREGGELICMTDPLTPDIHFDLWYYKDDPTHVIFYNDENLEWIRKNTGFNRCERNGRVIVLRK